ncbi:MAG: hypothetical protein HYR68_09875, partial [Burkholderiales bacterium]|nr:hypothetical protein [Burkholderiales bacterium]
QALVHAFDRHHQNSNCAVQQHALGDIKCQQHQAARLKKLTEYLRPGQAGEHDKEKCHAPGKQGRAKGNGKDIERRIETMRAGEFIKAIQHGFKQAQA